MRLKNVKGANAIIESSPFNIPNPTELKGSFNTVFKNNNPIRIEIGMGKGKFIMEQAIKNPDINFIGIEKFDSVLVRAVQKLEGKNIPNLKLIRMDALDIDQIFNHEIDILFLNFSDPWPKKRHSNRRLTSTIFLDKYKEIFKKDNQIIMKTDNRKLFEYSILSFLENNYQIEEISLDLHNDEIPDNITTEYEERFISLNKPIYMIKVIRH